MNNYFKEDFLKDFLSSIVVFLVALPLCMGIALASGVPPVLGLISGIIGGLVVAVFSGCPLQVSGPAAGLAVMVFNFVEKYGLESLVPLGIIVGVFQLVVNYFKLAEYFRAISPALIKGLLGAIGLLILVSQVHVAFDALPKSSGPQNIIHIPKSFYDLVVLEGGGRAAFGIAMLTLFSILSWQTFAKKLSKIIPGPLFAIIVTAVGANIFNLDLKFIDIPKNIIEELNYVQASSFSKFNIEMIITGLAIGFVASAETLLSVTAVDKLSDLETSNYNKEIKSQGIGNIIAGFLGAIPITGVIVRSSTNVASGGRTRWASFIHGIWLFVLTFIFTDVLSYIPVSALAGILIYVGWKLLNPPGILALYRKSKREAAIFGITFLLIVVTDLLTGVVIGFIASLGMLAFQLSKISTETTENDKEIRVKVYGRASFLQVPELSKLLPKSENGKDVILDISSLNFMDMAVEEQIQDWRDEQSKNGKKFEVIS